MGFSLGDFCLSIPSELTILALFLLAWGSPSDLGCFATSEPSNCTPSEGGVGRIAGVFALVRFVCVLRVRQRLAGWVGPLDVG